MKAIERIAILDFDHTLFRSEDYWKATLVVVNRAFGIEAEQLDAERQDRRPGAAGRLASGEGYDLLAHLEAHGVEPSLARATLLKELRGKEWLYPGTTELLAELKRLGFEVTILTVGSSPFQELKRDCCQNLSPELPFTTVGYNKGTYLATHWPAPNHLSLGGRVYTEALVVDDAADTFEALGERPDLIAIQLVNRPKYPHASPLPWVQTVHELIEIAPMIKRLR
jgi:beta-phosphoglucomutase-like phosphatase (HAD superfamily)